ncbi:MAG: hypothetical protein ACPKMZ_05820 [Pleomorphochaeta sp.]|nr:hypothetical protein [Sphaerochaetaceae bacterium]
MRNKLLTILFLLFILSPLTAASISFSGGYTTLSMREGNQQINLSNSANVAIDNIEISANEISLKGEDYDYIECNGNITFKDNDNQLTIRCSSLKYNRDTEEIIIEGWVEIDDLKNNIYATASYLQYNVEKAIIDLSVEVKLLHSSDDEVMKCSCDILRLDLEDKNVSLLGDSKVEWEENTYKAHAISINLNNNDISMDGSIEASINTK